MPFCSNCGQQINDGAKFCPSCGTAVSNEKQTIKGKLCLRGIYANVLIVVRS